MVKSSCNFTLLCATLVYICSTQINAQTFPQLRRISVRPYYQQQQSAFQSSFYTPPPPPSYYPPPPPAFYAPPPPPYYSPPAATPTYLPRNSGAAATSGTFWTGWNSLKSSSLMLFSPAVDVLSSSNYIAVVSADLRGIRATICQAGVSTQNNWVQINPGAQNFAIDSPATTYYNTKLYTSYCGNDQKMHYVVNTVSGTVITPAAEVEVTTYVVGGDFVCLGAPSSVLFGTTPLVYVFTRMIDASTTGTDTIDISSFDNLGVLTDAGASTTAVDIMFGPTAATYTDSSNVQHLVVAYVAQGGYLKYFDTTTTASPAATNLLTLPFTQSSLSCIGPPVAISMGTYVNIYCRTTNGYPSVSVIANGGETNTDTVTDGYMPRIFDGVYALSNINIFATSEDGTIYTRVLSQPNYATNTYTPPYTAPYNPYNPYNYW